MLFTGRENVFGVLEYSRSQSNKTVQHAFVKVFSKQSSTAMQILTWYKKFKEEGCCAGEKDLEGQRHHKRQLCLFVGNLTKPE